ncbi:alginate lyase family protein [Aurantiacibacter aquimixticola]|uniref:Alginate lyase n=1 Tax=Aurantiacibacter aquimixticola TaxID=1958945 RepID=A0A419RVT3_9SPHN|nr:alginate lyase family protein [Aurantiacibacter aquimixticola]RJY09910.1 alginate lyase [Aurantiacibacter aquimixticola]
MFRALSAAGLLALALAAPAQAQDASVTVPAFSPAEGAPQCRGVNGYAADFGGARTFLWRPRWIEAVTSGDMRPEVIEDAEAALANGPYSVTDKPRTVPGATRNDYASIGPYWWPDTSQSDGMPYTRRDGEVNPERDGPEFDKNRLRNLAADMQALALGYHATGDDRFAQHAAMLARTWFLDPATRMNPHFDFAQGIPGRVNGRGEGIIEASDLSTIAEALGLMAPSGALSAEERAGIRSWYGEFAVWMATSENGEDEMRKRNNHGVFFDFYLAHFALFAGAPDAAANVVRAFPGYRIGVQMDRQGRFIEELSRTRSWHYAHFVVDGAARLATIAECLDLDLWNARLADGRSLTTARDFLQRYAAAPESWPFEDTDLARGRVDRMRDRSARVLLYFAPDGVPGELRQLP